MPTAEKSGLNDEDLQELRAKIRVLEIKRADDTRHVKELETKLSEAETFVSLRPKLQAKLVQQQTELIEARRELADARQLSELAEARNLDTLEQLEMAMLDREVAEERAETAQSELEELKEKLAVVEVELEVIKEGACECALTCFKVAKLMCLKSRGRRQLKCRQLSGLHPVRETKRSLEGGTGPVRDLSVYCRYLISPHFV